MSQSTSAFELDRVPLSPDTPPQTVPELLSRLGLEKLTGVFVLNGFEDMDRFLDINEKDLDCLNVLDPGDRAKILATVEEARDTSDSRYLYPSAVENDHQSPKAK